MITPGGDENLVEENVSVEESGRIVEKYALDHKNIDKHYQNYF